MAKSDELKNSYTLFTTSLSHRRMTQAFAALQSYLNLSKAPWQLQRRLEELQNQYNLMSDYAMLGSADPERDKIYSRIGYEAQAIADEAARNLKSADDPSLYFSTLRYENLQAPDSLTKLVSEYSSLASKASMASFTGNDSASAKYQPEMERLETAIFNRIWTAYPLTQIDADTIASVLSSPALPVYFRRLTLSAVMLGGLEVCDERRLMLLASPYLSGDTDLEMPALCALLLLMWRHRDRMAGMRHFIPVGEALTEHKGWARDVKMVFMQFIRTRDTEKITRTIREDIGPSLMKLRPELDRMAGEDKATLDDLLNPEQNPEWMDMLDKSDIGDKLRKMSELQQEGADVMMSSFGNLKTFPFFNTISNWFLPFHTDHTSVAAAGKGVQSLINAIGASPALCDSDKYSFIFSLGMIPAAQRSMMESQLGAHADMMLQQNMSVLFPEAASREQAANRYVQDLYRFFRLFRRKGEFSDPFAAPVNLVGVKYADEALSDRETLLVLAEFYFKREYYSEAAEIFGRLTDNSAPDTSIYQKLAYSLQQLGKLEEALVWYERADLLGSDVWTTQRIAQILKLLGRYEEATEYYQRLDSMKPDNISVTFNLAGCMLHTKRYAEALRLYSKVEFLEGDSPCKCMRPIAWCSLLTRDFDRSRRYYDRIACEDSLTVTDMLNMGHLGLVTGHPEEALRCYRNFLRHTEYDVRRFEAELTSDRPTLVELGADPLLIDIVADKAIAGTTKE